MAFITAEIKIDEAALTVPVRLYFPTDLPDEVGNKVRGVITLLHGLSNTGEDWMRMGAACRYAADNGYILVAPSAGNSFYLNMAHGPPWHTILTAWLPARLQRIFRIPAAQKANHLAGLSMGGYGAVRIGLACPGRYATVGSFSGALDMAGMAAAARGNPALEPVLAPVLGAGLPVPDGADLFKLARAAAALPGGQKPRVFCTCGRQDDDATLIRTQNRSFLGAVRGLALDVTYMEWDGVHEWNFWDRSLAEYIGFIRGGGYGARKRADWAAETEIIKQGDRL